MEFSEQLKKVIPLFIIIFTIVFGLISVYFFLDPLNPLFIFLFASFLFIIILLIYLIPKKYISDIKVEMDKIIIVKLSKDSNIAKKDIKSIINYNGDIEIELTNSIVVIPIGDYGILQNLLLNLKNKDYPLSKSRIQNVDYYKNSFSNNMKIMIQCSIGMIICAILYGFASFYLLDYIKMRLLTIVFFSTIIVLSIIMLITRMRYVKEKRDSTNSNN
jgi:hypothetical protein